MPVFDSNSLKNDSVYRLKSLINEQISNINTSVPGVITQFNPTDGTVNCRPTVQKFAGLESFDVVEMVNVPAVYQSGGGYSITFPITPGDPCVILFSQTDIDNWATESEDLPPNTPRQFDMSDAMCIPGLRSPVNPLQNISQDGIQLSNEEGNVVLTVSNMGYSIRKDGDELFDLLRGMNDDLNEIVSLQTAANTISETAFITGTPTALQTAAPLLAAENAKIIKKIATFLERQSKLLNLSNPKEALRDTIINTVT